jgi:hypothetical protein
VLFDDYIDHAWLKKTWSTLGGGTIVHIRQANIGAARYLAKYLGKELLNGAKKKHRAISTSQEIKLLKLIKKSEDIKFRFCKVEDIEARSILNKYIVSDIHDSKNRVLGFLSQHRLGGNDEATLRNVGRLV